MTTTVNSSIRKSVRIPSDLVEYVEFQDGKDFTDKLINLLYEVKDGEEKRKHIIEQYDSIIEQRQKQMYDLNRKVNEASLLVNRLSAFTKAAEASGIDEINVLAGKN